MQSASTTVVPSATGSPAHAATYNKLVSLDLLGFRVWGVGLECAPKGPELYGIQGNPR